MSDSHPDRSGSIVDELRIEALEAEVARLNEGRAACARHHMRLIEKCGARIGELEDGLRTEYRVWWANGHHAPTTDLAGYLAWSESLGHEVVSVETRSVTDWLAVDESRATGGPDA